jgi:hypothetical protein
MTVNKETAPNFKDKLIDKTFPLVDSLLEKYGEFFPLAAVVLQDDSLASVATYDGDEKPLSDTVIAHLKKAIKEGFKNGEYKAAVIFYDVYAMNPSTNIKSDAVAIIYESAEENIGFHFFYPYKLSKKKELTYERGWYNEVSKEILVK